jgi:hypothetical protein
MSQRFQEPRRRPGDSGDHEEVKKCRSRLTVNRQSHFSAFLALCRFFELHLNAHLDGQDFSRPADDLKFALPILFEERTICTF